MVNPDIALTVKYSTIEDRCLYVNDAFRIDVQSLRLLFKLDELTVRYWEKHMIALSKITPPSGALLVLMEFLVPSWEVLHNLVSHVVPVEDGRIVLTND